MCDVHVRYPAYIRASLVVASGFLLVSKRKIDSLGRDKSVSRAALALRSAAFVSLSAQGCNSGGQSASVYLTGSFASKTFMLTAWTSLTSNPVCSNTAFG